MTGNWTGQSTVTSFNNAENESYFNATPLNELAIANILEQKFNQTVRFEVSYITLSPTAVK